MITFKEFVAENIEHEHVKNLLARHDIDVHTIDTSRSPKQSHSVFINNPDEKHESGQSNYEVAKKVLHDNGLHNDYWTRAYHPTKTKGAFGPTSTI